MGRVCEITKSRAGRGNRVSHAHNCTKRVFNINLQNVTFSTSFGFKVRVRVTPNAVRTVEKKGGIEAFVFSQKEKDLSPKLRLLKKRLLSIAAFNEPKNPVS